MSASARPCRSVLYIPGSNERALEKATTLPVDAIIFDLEDAVTPSAKDEARARLVETLQNKDFGGRLRLVRINGFDTAWGDDDLSALAEAAPDGILMSKVGEAEQVQSTAAKMDGLSGYAETKIWTMIESPDGILNAAAIAKAPRMGGFILGTNDLVKDLNAQVSPDRAEIMTSLQLSLLAARSAGIFVIDGVYNAFKDVDGLTVECQQGRALGFDGKSLIHPAQIETANRIFSPAQVDIDLAKRQIQAFEAAEAAGQGVAVLDGKIVENLHVVTARKIIAIDKAIRAMES